MNSFVSAIQLVEQVRASFKCQLESDPWDRHTGEGAGLGTTMGAVTPHSLAVCHPSLGMEEWLLSMSSPPQHNQFFLLKGHCGASAGSAKGQLRAGAFTLRSGGAPVWSGSGDSLRQLALPG